MKAPYYEYCALIPPYPVRHVKPVADSANHWCGESPDDTKPVLYFSGQFGRLMTEVSLPHAMGVIGRCVSYCYLSDKRTNLVSRMWPTLPGKRLFLDSGAFTLQKEKASWERVMEYASHYKAYLEETQFQWDWYAGLDYKRDCAIIRKSHDALVQMGLRPTPVYHGDSSLEYLERYCKEGNKLICIGKPPKSMSVDLDYFYGHCHEVAAKYGTRLHGFQETGKRMFKYPWWSCDSSSWLAGGKQGQVFLWDESTGSFSNIRITNSDLEPASDVRWDWKTAPPFVKTQVLSHAEKLGLTEDMMLHSYHWRNCFNASVMMNAVQKWSQRKDNSNQSWKTLV